MAFDIFGNDSQLDKIIKYGDKDITINASDLNKSYENEDVKVKRLG